MNDLTKDKGWVRWYPLTYPGYYTSEMMRVHSFCHECCRLDLSRFRGQTIGPKAVSEEEEIALYPYGCAKLRMTEMPII